MNRRLALKSHAQLSLSVRPFYSSKNTLSLFILVCVIALAVFGVGNFDIFTNPYLVNDDVRQQLFWMERWHDPHLFQDDFLTNYAEAYVPFGVKGIYRLASFWFDPLLFSNILTAILFSITGGIWFVWGRLFGDDLTAFLVAVVYFLFSGFQAQIAGGLARAFVLPLLLAYLLFVSQGRFFHAGLVILVQTFFNPYLFLLCLSTHVLIMIVSFGPRVFPGAFVVPDYFSGPLSRLGFSQLSEPLQDLDRGPGFGDRPPNQITQVIKKILTINAPVVLAMLFALVNVLWFQSSTGHLISWKEMLGKSEYGELGRYELFPAPSFFYELIEPWILNLSFPYWGPVAGWIMALATVTVFVHAVLNYRPVVKWERLSGLLFLIPVSLTLYVLARLFLVKLFVPNRYISYTLNIIYCISFAVALRILSEKIRTSRFRMLCFLLALLAFACVKVRHVGFYDFSEHANLYKFIETIPKNAISAGQPEIMDNVMTFGKRPSYVTYELSHTWVEPYWGEVKKRTFDLFKAYYSSDPEVIKTFCKSNNIKYLIVRSEDFDTDRLRMSPAYFEPFNGFIWYLTNSTNYFAVLDKALFPPIFEEKGIRVLQIQ